MKFLLILSLLGTTYGYPQVYSPADDALFRYDPPPIYTPSSGGQGVSNNIGFTSPGVSGFSPSLGPSGYLGSQGRPSFPGPQDIYTAPSSSYQGPGGPVACRNGEVVHVDGSCVAPIVTRKVYLYSAPQQLPIRGPPPKIPLPKVEHNVLFIRAPYIPQGPDPVVIPPPRQQNIVYVLNRRTQEGQKVIELPTPPPASPEVYFVNYGPGETPTLPGGIDFQDALDSAIQGEGKVVVGGGGLDGVISGGGNGYGGSGTGFAGSDTGFSGSAGGFTSINNGLVGGRNDVSSIGGGDLRGDISGYDVSQGIADQSGGLSVFEGSLESVSDFSGGHAGSSSIVGLSGIGGGSALVSGSSNTYANQGGADITVSTDFIEDNHANVNNFNSGESSANFIGTGGIGGGSVTLSGGNIGGYNGIPGAINVVSKGAPVDSNFIPGVSAGPQVLDSSVRIISQPSGAYNSP